MSFWNNVIWTDETKHNILDLKKKGTYRNKYNDQAIFESIETDEPI